MERLFLDTNVILRYLTNDDRERGRRSRRLLLRATRAELQLVTSESVIMEAVEVLSSPNHYRLSRDQVALQLSTLLAVPGIDIVPKGVYLRALQLWADSTVDFVDTLSVAHMEHQAIATIASFDRDFDRFPQITWQEP
jgi:predicted nucleic acid-binding protein